MNRYPAWSTEAAGRARAAADLRWRRYRRASEGVSGGPWAERTAGRRTTGGPARA